MLKQNLIIAILIILWGCGEDPYVEQINKAHDILNQGKLNNSQELLKEAGEEYRKAYSYALFALEKEYDALFNLGLLHAFNGEFQHCIKVMSQAYEIRRSDPDLFFYWGMCYANEAKIALETHSKENNINQAKKIYQLGLENDPTVAKLNYGLGILHGFIGDDYIKALEYLNMAHQSKPEDINTLFAIANLNYKLGNVKESIEYFSSIMRLTKPGSSSYEQAKANLEKIR